MIVIPDKIGSLCNNLRLFTHLIFFGNENKVNIFCPGFKIYKSYFKGTQAFRTPFYKFEFGNNTKCSLWGRIKNSILSKFISLLYLLKISSGYTNFITSNDGKFQLCNENNMVELKKSSITFINGYNFYYGVDYGQIPQSDTVKRVREYFEPLDSYLNQIEHYMSDLGNDHDVLVGIHMRRGDYKYYNDGKFYFDDSVYLYYIQRLTELLKEKKPLFMLCSDEEIDIDYFKKQGVNAVVGPGDMICDLYSLARCDYIIAPPSSYSTWASFYGDVPLCRIRDIKQELKLEKFRVFSGL